MSAIYGAHAATYLEAGWAGVLPLPPSRKKSPPSGYTGRAGAYPSAEQVAAWAASESDGNIGLRMPELVVGIDVDHYDKVKANGEVIRKRGGDILASLEDDLGPLPPTWVSTSRAAPSGIRLYRLPRAVELITELGDIEIIQRHHRYAVVWPSVNPDSGQEYGWLTPDHEMSLRPPRVDELAELPEAWLDFLETKAEPAKQRPSTPPAPIPAGAPDFSPAVERVLADRSAWTSGSRHDQALRLSMALARLENSGHPGATEALELVGDEFRAAIDGERGRNPDKEWDDMVTSAQKLAATTASTRPTYGELMPDKGRKQRTMSPCDESVRSDQSPSDDDLRSHRSLRSQVQTPFDLPDGLELWTGAEATDQRPKLVDGPAFDSWPGEIVNQIAPYTEAEPGGVLLTLLTAAGASMGAGPHIVAGNTQHPPRLSTLLAGETSRGRKGTSWEALAPILERADPMFFPSRVMGGFGSGEAVVDEVADPDEEGKGGSTDKRLLLKDSEFTRTLKVAARDGSTLSELIREAWDGGRLQVRSRTKRSVATGAHVCVVGHVTLDGLRRHLADEDVVNGFANRLLFCAVGRARVLPYGAEVPDALVAVASKTLAESIRQARRRHRVQWSDDARDAWESFYYRCAEDDTAGVVGAITARAEPQVARLSLLFSLLDQDATEIELEHHLAAEAIWQHNVDTVRWVFGDKEGDPDADKLLAAVRATGAHGMTGTEQRDLFGRHKGRDLERIRERLERRGLVASGMVPTDGRPTLVTVAVQPATEATKATEA